MRADRTEGRGHRVWRWPLLLFFSLGTISCPAARLPVVPQPQAWLPDGTDVTLPVKASYSIVPDAELGPEGYELAISRTGLVARASTQVGLGWA